MDNTHVQYIIIGFVSNGEYKSMRVKGNTRPLSVLQIKANARKKYSSAAHSTMVDMLTPKGVSELCVLTIIYM